jgi:hypothetical protein
MLEQIKQLLPDLSQDEKHELLRLLNESLKDDFFDDYIDDEGNTNPLVRRYRYLPRREAMFDQGILKVGDRIHVLGHDQQVAAFVSPDEVSYDNQVMNLDAWVRQVTGKASLNSYDVTILERANATLTQMREQFLTE